MKMTLYLDGRPVEVDGSPSEIAEMARQPGWSADPPGTRPPAPAPAPNATEPGPISPTTEMRTRIKGAVVYQKSNGERAIALYDGEDLLGNGDPKQWADFHVWAEEFNGPIAQCKLDMSKAALGAPQRRAAMNSEFWQPIEREAVVMPKLRNGIVVTKKNGHVVWFLHHWADESAAQSVEPEYEDEDEDTGFMYGWDPAYATDAEQAYNWSKQFIGSGDPEITEEQLQGLWLETGKLAKKSKVATASLWYEEVITLIIERTEELPF